MFSRCNEAAGGHLRRFETATRPITKSLLVGEVTTTGPASNCPAHQAAEPECRVIVEVTPRPAPAAHPAAPAPVARPPKTTAPVRVPRMPAAATPVVPAPALPRPTATAANPTLFQLDRAPLLPAPGPGTAAGPGVPAAAPTVVRSVLRSADYSQHDLSGRAFSFLVGGLAFLLVTVLVVGRLAVLRGARRRPVTDK